MKKSLITVFSLVLGALALSAQSLPLPAGLDAPFDPKTASFVTREGSKLVLDGQEYRFLSVNIPNYHIVEDPAYEGAAKWHRVTEFEQRDAARTVRYLGGRAFRIYVPSVQGGKNVAEGLAHVAKDSKGKVTYNEQLFRDLDRGLAIAASEGVRVIIPLVDNWDSFGGHKEWAMLAGLYNFWDKAKSKDEFKKFITWLLNRTNTVSGVKYKDDPTILCWELGNEIRLSTPEWAAEISAHIKKNDPKHLLMDGGYTWVRPDHLKNPNIDICTTHYTNEYLSGFITECLDANKVYIYGEFEPKNAAEVDSVGKLIAESKAAGAMIWSLRFRTEFGGFYFHGDFGHSDSLQYPGWNITNPLGAGPVDEKEIFSALKKWAWQIRGYSAPNDPLPDAPTLLKAPVGFGLSWKGSVGAISYELESASSANGPWTVVATKIMELKNSGDRVAYFPIQPLWPLLPESKGTWYRLYAINNAGKSPASIAFLIE